MAAGVTQGADEDIYGINVTPFVDIALVLLIIFIVTAKYIITQSIPVDLPEAATSQQQAQASTASVSIDRGEQVFLDARPVTDPELVALMRARYDENHEVRAIIAADRAVPHGRVTRVLDLVRQAGVSRFAIQTEQGEAEPTR
ncbi:MAG: biopolymer transporter ExbD [Deltaproteobacteria bacterium]|nr:biopolymer transporter ExbD [Deltaproteobacteria bacterium]